MFKQRKILFVHLNNDFSGSPVILYQVILACLRDGFECQLLVGNRGGILDDLPVERTYLNYRLKKRKFTTIYSYIITQLRMFINILSVSQQYDTIYINTTLPCGAALAAWLHGCPVVSHIHEVKPFNGFFKRCLYQLAELFSNRMIYVSKTACNAKRFQKHKQFIIYNALSPEFEQKAYAIQPNLDVRPFTLLMISTARVYKGVLDFLQLAKACRDHFELHFILVLGADQSEISTFFSGIELPHNLSVHPCTRDTLPYYRQSQVLLNLSHPEQVTESFGLTALEAMACGIPVIVPPIGGPAELVREGKEGFLINGKETEKIKNLILTLMLDKDFYMRISHAAKTRAMEFSNKKFSEKIIEVLSRSVTQSRRYPEK
jgi:L-malate glycosyltransferase